MNNGVGPVTRKGAAYARAVPLVSRLAIYAACFFDTGIDKYGVVLFLVLVSMSLFCIPYAIARKPDIFIYFAPSFVISLIYIILSYGAMLPTSWTIMHRNDVIPHQAAWALILPICASTGFIYYSRVFAGNEARELFVITVLIAINTIISGFALTEYHIAYGFLGYLWAPLSILLASASWAWIFGNIKWPIALIAAALLAAVFLSAGSQTAIAYSITLLFLLTRSLPVAFHRGIFLTIVLAIILGHLWVWVDPLTAYRLDPNIGIRGLFAKNALEALRDTNYLGVGYGTESIKNVYAEIGLESFHNMGDEFISIANHNAFLDVAMRQGIPGVLALLTILSAGVVGRQNPMGAPFQYALMSLIVLNLSVNVGLQSPYHAVGIAVMLGAIMASRGVGYRSVSQ